MLLLAGEGCLQIADGQEHRACDHVRFESAGKGYALVSVFGIGTIDLLFVKGRRFVWQWTIGALSLFLIGFFTVPAQAGFADGCQAFHQGVQDYRTEFARTQTTEPSIDLGLASFDRAVALWRRAAWIEDDLLSQYWLGLLYRAGIDLNDLQTLGPRPDCVSQFTASDTSPFGANNAYTIYQESVESAVWFFLVTINPTTSGQSTLLATKRDEYRQSAQAALRQIIASFGTDELQDVEKRIQYILSKRRADGYLRLAEIYDSRSTIGTDLGGFAGGLIPETESQLQKQAFEGDRPPAGESGQSRQPGLPPGFEIATVQDEDQGLVCRVFGLNCRTRTILLPDQSSGPRIEPLEQLSIQRRRAQQDQQSVGDRPAGVLGENWSGADPRMLIARPNTIDALTFYLLASKEGHPIARLLLGDLIAQIGFSDPTIELAEIKAERWQPPFEYYPGGYDFYPLGNRDDWATDWTSAESLWALTDALERVDVELNDQHVVHALRVLSYYKGNKKAAIRNFQAEIVEQQTGQLTSLQTVRLMQRAADTGDAISQVRLGIMYGNGWGVPASAERAKFWFGLAAKQDSVNAHYNLYMAYAFEGQSREAQYHLQRACELNGGFVRARGVSCRT